jgi:hypothetical protein
LDETPLPTLSKLEGDERVLTVDTGHFQEFLDAMVRSECVRFALPDPLWYLAKEFE